MKTNQVWVLKYWQQNRDKMSPHWYSLLTILSQFSSSSTFSTYPIQDFAPLPLKALWLGTTSSFLRSASAALLTAPHFRLVGSYQKLKTHLFTSAHQLKTCFTYLQSFYFQLLLMPLLLLIFAHRRLRCASCNRLMPSWLSILLL